MTFDLEFVGHLGCYLLEFTRWRAHNARPSHDRAGQRKFPHPVTLPHQKWIVLTLKRKNSGRLMAFFRSLARRLQDRATASFLRSLARLVAEGKRRVVAFLPPP